MLNVYNMTSNEIILFIDDYQISNIFNKHKTLELKKRFLTIYGYDLRLIALKKQAEAIQAAIIEDCIEFFGLHKLIDFNILSAPFKRLAMTLFTSYQPLTHSILQCNEAIKKSLEVNQLQYCDKDFIKDLFDFTQTRLQNLKLINEIIWLQSDNKKYIEFMDKLEYDFPYPFLERFDNE